MSSKLYSLLESYRQSSKTNRELGTYFEDLVIAYFENDDVQKQFYDKVWTYADWVEETGLADSKADVGIDLVAKLKDSQDEYCAIQCKFYEKSHKLQRKDLDSFFSASSKKPFVRRILIDTTDLALGKNAQDIFEDKNQYVESQRISLSDLEKSRIDWVIFAEKKAVVLKAKKIPRKHQLDAIKAVNNAFQTVDRGKMIMACGTGKTYTGLKIAETYAGKGKRVLFMVPSLALMSQTVTEWSNDTEVPLRCFAVCSDVSVGKRKSDDIAELNQHDLAFPATTDGAKIAREASLGDPNTMTVVFSTYQSIQALTEAQKQHGLPEFDLIICDEAHRTTGATLSGEDDSNFVRIHHNEYVKGKKRLYMTATPRIFGEGAKGKADDEGHTLASMDDEKLFGHVLFSRDFTWAVENDLLTDYKVIVLAMDEGLVSRGVQNLLSSGENELQLDDASRIIGCYKALTKSNLQNEISYDAHPMKRALAFCKDIKASKLIEAEFSDVTEEYLENTPDEPDQELHCTLHHVDGTFNAKERNKLLDWLKDEPEDDECRILTNARCLSEGVDVPALDAIMFLHPRKSQIDVVQSVGRVMRKAEGKKMGYVILPIGVPSGVSPEEALNDNEKYKVVWQILNALRAHDERVDATINKAGLGEDISNQVQIVGVNADNLRSVTAVVEDIPMRDNGSATKEAGIGQGGSGNDDYDTDDTQMGVSSKLVQAGFNFNEEISNAIIAQIVKKCGTRDYWEDWAKDIAEIAQKHITRIKATLDNPNGKAKAQFDSFLKELRDDLNDSITEDETIEMLAQHLITRPVFETLFEGHTFTKENQVSSAIQKVLDVLDEHSIDKESKSLEKFYASVKRKAKGIETSAGKQRLVVELYDKFFRSAFPRLTEKLGIVYTPVEVVDFIIHSVNDVLQNEFGQSLGSKGVHIIDPFTGTGTFITRLLQSGLIKPEELEYKFKNEIHANEIVLLAYYIAGINIEAVYHDLQKEAEYTPFEGICLTDTFQMYEQEDMIQNLLAVNSERRVRQKSLPLKVIIGNPPYSAGQSSANDNNANQGYPYLDESIRVTYVAKTKATNKNALYDSYIRAIRWGSDRLGSEGGVMAYVSNAGWVDGNAMDGLRKCLAEEYSSIYVFHLRGNQRTQGELSRKEGGKIFGSGSRSPIAITVFVKNPQAEQHGQIYFYDIGDYLSQKEKLSIVEQFGSVNGITKTNGWTQITPDEHNDWLNQRDTSFGEHIVLGDKKDKTGSILKLFNNYSRGLETGRDSWCYNSSKAKLAESMESTIAFYNSEVDRYAKSGEGIEPKDFVNNDSTKISWTSSLYPKIKGLVKVSFNSAQIIKSLYRPYSEQYACFDPVMNHRVGQMERIFPLGDVGNFVIDVSGVGSKSFTVLMVNHLPCLDSMEKGQCFPLKLYEPTDNTPKDDLFADLDAETVDGYTVKDGITDEGLAHFQQAYPNEKITKEDIFYYVYGLLHSEDYRERYADNLSKELPRIPRVKEASDFWAFVNAGRKLGDLHVNYEDAAIYPVELKTSGKKSLDDLTDDDYRVDKKWVYIKIDKVIDGKVALNDKGRPQKENDLTRVKYNKQITITGIPEEAYDYVVNGRPALEWVMERQMVKTDKASGIVNDANDFAIETMGNPKYPLELFQKVITVSLETMKIVRSLPKLNEFYEGEQDRER